VIAQTCPFGDLIIVVIPAASNRKSAAPMELTPVQAGVEPPVQCRAPVNRKVCPVSGMRSRKSDIATPERRSQSIGRRGGINVALGRARAKAHSRRGAGRAAPALCSPTEEHVKHGGIALDVAVIGRGQRAWASPSAGTGRHR